MRIKKNGERGSHVLTKVTVAAVLLEPKAVEVSKVGPKRLTPSQIRMAKDQIRQRARRLLGKKS